MILREMLPERSADDIAAGRIRLTFGVGADQRNAELLVLPIRANRTWVEQLNASLGGVWEGLDDVAKPAQMLGWLAGQVEPMLVLLAAYDTHDTLPDRDWLEEHATDQQVLSAFLGVCAAAHPLAVSVVDALSSDSELLRMAIRAALAAFSTPMPTPAPPSAGRSAKRKKN